MVGTSTTSTDHNRPTKKRHYNAATPDIGAAAAIMITTTTANTGSTTTISSTGTTSNTKETTTVTAKANDLQQLQPITMDGIRPQKRFYRQRAHCNPLAHNDSYDYPIHPNCMDWTTIYPSCSATTPDDGTTAVPRQRLPQSQRQPLQPTVLDIGCGFGGLTLALASILVNENDTTTGTSSTTSTTSSSNSLICGMEIRAKVTEYVRLRIIAARHDFSYTINPHAISTSIPPSSLLLGVPPVPSLQKTITTTPNPDRTTTTEETRTTSTGEITVDDDDDDVNNNMSFAVTEVSAAEEIIPPPQSQQQSQQYHHHHYRNCGVLRTNSMKYLPNYFCSHSIAKVFVCFPDPHFKRKNHCRRIISYRLLDEYAYILLQQPPPQHPPSNNKTTNTNGNGNGLLYAITDVKELHEWHIHACTTHPLFEPILIGEQSSSLPSTTTKNTTTASNGATDNSNHQSSNVDRHDDDEEDPCLYAMKYLTEEGQKVDRNHGTKYYIVYQCIATATAANVGATTNDGNNKNDNSNNNQPSQQRRLSPPKIHARNFFAS